MKIYLLFWTFFLSLPLFGKLDNCKKYFSTYKEKFHFAKGIKVFKKSGAFLVILKNPKGDPGETQEFILLNKGVKTPSFCGKKKTFSIPFKRIVPTSTTHLALLERVNALENHVVGFPGKKYINSPKARGLIEKGKIVDVGYPPIKESVLTLNPQVILAFAVSPLDDQFQLFEKFKIPVLFISAFRESHPLGRAEWVKLFGLMTGNLEKSRELFNQISRNYQKVVQKMKSEKVKPKVIVGNLNSGKWRSPGGKSYFSQFLKDAGANYFLKENKKSDSVILNFEEVLKLGRKSDYWLPQGEFLTKKDLFSSNSRYGLLEIRGKIYNNNKRLNKFGGNDYWENAFTRPDLLLMDLAKIFHPKKFSQDQLLWYQELK